MARKAFAVILFIYAIWQIITYIDMFGGNYRSSQITSHLFWAFAAGLGGFYLFKKSK